MEDRSGGVRCIVICKKGCEEIGLYLYDDSEFDDFACLLSTESVFSFLYRPALNFFTIDDCGHFFWIKFLAN